MSLEKGNEALTVLCQSAPLKHLIRECDAMARRHRDNAQKEGLHNLKFLGLFTLIRKNILINRSIKEALRIIDAHQIECEHAKKKF